MLNKPLIGCLAAALLVSGCATLAPEPAGGANTRTYAVGRDAIWQRILTGSARNSMFVTQADNRNGVISVERDIAHPDGGTVYDWADCGWTSVFERTVSQRVELNYVVRPDHTGATVTLNGRFQELRVNIASRNAHWVTCTSTGVLERQLLESFYYD